MISVLFAALKWDYGKKERGDSFEYSNLFDSLRRMNGVQARFFPIDESAERVGRTKMHQQLVDTVRDQRPDLVFFFLYENELSPKLVDAITAETLTFNWFADDSWRFEIFSKAWAPHFSLVGTTDPNALERYRSAGISNVIATQWACNHHRYAPLHDEKDLQAVFIGQAHGDRVERVRALRDAGVDVKVWGHGWPGGRIDFEEMVRIYSRAQIALNFAAGSAPKQFSDRLKFVAFSGRRIANPLTYPARLAALKRRALPQIKGRTFEIPGCSTLLVTDHVPGLETYYVPDKEIIAARNTEDMVDQTVAILEDPISAQQMANAGFHRTIRDHTYERRFHHIFDCLGLSAGLEGPSHGR